MRAPRRIVSLVLLLVLPAVTQCQVGDHEYGFTSRGRPTIRVGALMSDLCSKVSAAEIRPLREDRGEPGAWTSITVDYVGLEISYWKESDSIYYLSSAAPEWRVTEKLGIGAVFNVADFAHLKPITTEREFLLPYEIEVGERRAPAYCMVTVTEEMVIREISLFFAFD